LTSSLAMKFEIIAVVRSSIRLILLVRIDDGDVENWASVTL